MFDKKYRPGLFVSCIMCGEIATECPPITADNFHTFLAIITCIQEQHLTSDDTLVDFLNDFLSLPSFQEPLLYNQKTGIFEVANRAAEHVSRKITSVRHIGRSQLLSHDSAMLARSLPIDNQYTVCCLEREQGLQWVLQERFPLFIQSDFYFEYRLAKLLFQKSNNLHEERTTTEGWQNDMKEEGNTFEVEEGSGATHEKNVHDICCHSACCHSSRHGLDQFKVSLQGTPGENTLYLWMDIERLKATQKTERKNRHLDLMRDIYLQNGSKTSINVDLLNYLGLSTPSCWTEEKLFLVQLHLTDVLLSYWAPRCWMLQHVQGERCDSGNVGLWTEKFLRRPSGTQSSTLYSTLPQQAHVEFNTSTCSAVLDTETAERMLQALFFDSLAGLYFTCFCENSGNKLWENAVYFWTELQLYYQLPYNIGEDTYRIQRRAKLLYSTYLRDSARRSIGVEVVSNNTPTFKELFDRAEEHTLSVLLEAWTQLVARETETFGKVCKWEDVRQVDSELRRLCEASLEQQVEGTTPPPTEGPQESSAWSNVSPRYQGYRLGSINRSKQELRHFMTYLREQDASIHLSCWLDLEQYRRSFLKDKSPRQKRSSAIIVDKYLSNKYFFGSDSPASTEQQKDIKQLVGGSDEILNKRVVEDIQNIISSYIEEKWLPQFLATAEFKERQEHKSQASDGNSEQVHRQLKKQRETLKLSDGLWMSSTEEILQFRRVLLNPVTCEQFQYFVSVKGDFLENDVLFWLEVQRYKELCHSHCDEAIIQHKISIIINCFITSPVPPALQIDIPEEMAQHILTKRKEMGPYVFREAQTAVFRELLKQWPQFQELRSRVKEAQLLPLLKKKKKQHIKHRAKQQGLRRNEEEGDRIQDVMGRLSVTEEREKEEDNMAREGEKGDLGSSPTYKISWSYSKYMGALKNEEQRQKLQSQATSSAASSSCSGISAGRAGIYSSPCLAEQCD